MASDLCGGLLDLVIWLAIAFLAAALIIGVISAIIAFWSPKPTFGTARTADATAITPLLEALKGIIEAIGSAPAGFALFLAGTFLLWMAGDVYVDSCKPPETKVARTIAETKTTTRTETARPAANPKSGRAPAL